MAGKIATMANQIPVRRGFLGKNPLPWVTTKKQPSVARQIPPPYLKQNLGLSHGCFSFCKGLHFGVPISYTRFLMT